MKQETHFEGLENQTVSGIIHELDMAKMERANKRQMILSIILLAALILSNLFWVIRDSAYVDIVETTIEAEQTAEATDGGNAITNANGGDLIYYGESPSDGEDH